MICDECTGGEHYQCSSPHCKCEQHEGTRIGPGLPPSKKGGAQPYGSRLPKTEQDFIIRLYANHPGISQSELSRRSGVSRDQVRTILRQLPRSTTAMAVEMKRLQKENQELRRIIGHMGATAQRALERVRRTDR